MMTALATVQSVIQRDNAFDVELGCEQQTSCSHCSSASSCGTGVVSKAVGKKTLKWTLTTEKALTVGQVVEIGFPEKTLLQSASLVYVVPLLALIFGAMIGQFLTGLMGISGEFLIIVSSFVLMAVAILWARAYSRTIDSKVDNQITITRVLGQPIL